MITNGLSSSELKLESLGDPGDRYKLDYLLGSGVCSDVYVATDNQAGGKRVAVKIQNVVQEYMSDIQEEYRILRDLSDHSNLPDFYGAYLKKGKNSSERDQVWFVMQLCEGGPIVDLVRGLQSRNKKMNEEHIAYILREVVKALVHLHENHVIHRDVKGSNILLTKDGEVKLADFGLSREVMSTEGKRFSSLGSPCWMAPEVVTSGKKEGSEILSYDSRADVWALGITAIELGDGKPPFQDMHPTRALFQIVRNPPPTLYRPANWSQLYNDFITECLEKNQDNRPYMVELLEHPFLTSLPENDFHFPQELKVLLDSVTSEIKSSRKEEVTIRKGVMQKKLTLTPETMHVEDLAALEDITEDSIVNELHERHNKGSHYTFIGDILLYLNPNKDLNIYSPDMHVKYQLKSRSENAPHIYSVGDSAYQDALHHEEQQHIIFSGETLSGKTANFRQLINHLLYLGLSPNKVGDKILASLNILQAVGNAATPLNNNSTRHVLQTQITYANSGKVSGAIFWLYQLEKWRVTGNRIKQHANFHIFYYFYDWAESVGKLEKYKLDGGRFYKYLRTSDSDDDENNPSTAPLGPREKPEENVKKFEDVKKYMNDLEFESEEQELLWKMLAAILLLGEVDFKGDSEGKAEIKNTEIANKVAQLLDVDEKKFSWAVCNYCLIQSGTAVKRRHTVAEAKEATHVLARCMYFRIVDWLVNMINVKLSFSRAVFGDKFCISALDLFGFECYQRNGLEQLFVNTLNEQLQYHYNQRVFVWEMQEQEEEQISLQPLQYYDNKPTLDELMNKPDGLLYIIDEANKNNQGADFIIEKLQNNPKGPRVRMSTTKDFCVAHYTGKVAYDTNDITEKNRDFLPPEMVETLRQSNNSVIRTLFTNQLSRSGNLTIMSDQNVPVTTGKKKRWGAALVAEKQEARKYNTQSQGEYSQTRRMRTASAVFRASSLEVMRSLASGQKDSSGASGTHFVRCVRSDLSGQPLGFQPEIVRQQLRALAVIDTARARQKGYSHRVTFSEFIRRYKFLAFDFDENVEVTKDNCRLLLVRLKMEGWAIGKTKVFLRYYNEEYLSRLYETQVKKIVKVQSMMRAFLAKRNVAGKLQKHRQDSIKKEASRQNSEQKSENEEGGGKHVKQSKPVVKAENISEEEAAVIIQKQYRGYQTRKQFGPMLHSGKLDEETVMLMKQYCKKWRAQSVFQVLLLYRAARHQDLVYMSQQAHLFNQNAVSGMLNNNKEKVILNTINCDLKAREFIGRAKQPVRKLPFRLNDFDYCDSSFLCNSMAKRTLTKELPWDAPFKRVNNRYYYCSNQDEKKIKNINCNEEGVLNFIETPYCRDPYSAEELYRGQQYRKGDWNYTKKKERINSLKKTKAPPVPDSASRNSNRGQQLPVADKSEHSNQFNYKEPFDFYEMNYGMSSNPVGNRRGSSNFDPLPSNFNNCGVSGYIYNSKNPSTCSSPVPNSSVFKEPMGHSNYGYQSPDYGLSFYGSNNRELKPVAHPPGVSKQVNNNPIRELELLGKQAGYNANDYSDEQPPYNFQAMLRKTNHNRASLRRSPELEIAFKNNQASKNMSDKDITNRSNMDNNRSGFQSNRGYSNVVYNSSAEHTFNNNHPNQFERQDSRTVLNTKIYSASKPSLKQTREHESFSSTTEVAEIAPGIIVEGQVADL